MKDPIPAEPSLTSCRVGVRELKNRTSELVRGVGEGMEYVVTVRGEPRAVLRAVTAEDAARWHRGRRRAALDEVEALADEIADAWDSSRSPTDLVEEQRR